MLKDTFETADSDRSEDDESAISDPTPHRETRKTQRRAAPKKITSKKKPAPYRKPSLSSTDAQSSSDDDPAPKGPKLRQRGADKRTGELTLIGQFPPLIGDDSKTYWCPHEACRMRDPISKKLQYWKTSNGYKYHLQHVCPQNPESTRSLRAAMASEAQTIDSRTTRKKRFWMTGQERWEPVKRWRCTLRWLHRTFLILLLDFGFLFMLWCLRSL
jgi:hypothetical protein